MNIAQQIAALAVNAVLNGRNLTLALPEALLIYADATPQQRATAQDLSYGTLRYYGEVEAYLSQLLEKPLDDKRLFCLLSVAIYQLLHDKAESFTVVNQAVIAAAQFKKPVTKPWAKGLVNGVLRNFLRQQNDIKQTISTNEVALYSYPIWWINKLKKQYPSSWQAILEAGNQHPPMTLRINKRQTDVAQYQKNLSDLGYASSILSDTALMLEKPLPVEQLLGFATGEVSVQDLGAQYIAELLDLKPEQHVLDACCAPGGKTGHILESADVHLVAIDNDEQRLGRVAGNLRRLKLQAHLLVGDAVKMTEWVHGEENNGYLFDRILADVPCTASGIVRRHVDIKWLRREADIGSFARQQAAILENLWQCLAKEGKLLYVTCSIFAEENQLQIASFLAKTADATQLTIPYDQLLPCAQNDGFFYALLQKN